MTHHFTTYPNEHYELIVRPSTEASRSGQNGPTSSKHNQDIAQVVLNALYVLAAVLVASLVLSGN